jgi:hypothetical protein
MPPLLEQLPLMRFESRIVVTGDPLQGIHQGLILPPKLLVPMFRVKAFEGSADGHLGLLELAPLSSGADHLKKAGSILDQNLGEALKQKFHLRTRDKGAIELALVEISDKARGTLRKRWAVSQARAGIQLSLAGGALCPDPARYQMNGELIKEWSHMRLLPVGAP